MATALIIALVAVTGCKEDWGDEIDDLTGRVANLEALSNQLKQKVDAGALVKSVTPLAGGGWKIEFTSGDPIEVSNIVGNTGDDVTEINIGANGNWFIDGEDTGVKAAGKDGVDGTNGEDGTDGEDGAPGSVITIGANGNWYIDGADTGKPSHGENGTDGTDGKDGTPPHIGANGNWFIGDTDTGIAATGPKGADGAKGDTGATGEDGDTKILNIAENAVAGTVTITMNAVVNTQYIFRKASTTVSFAIMVAGRVDIAPGATGKIPFTVNPSNAYISTTLVDWVLNDAATGAASTNFAVTSVAKDGDKPGRYIAP